MTDFDRGSSAEPEGEGAPPHPALASAALGALADALPVYVSMVGPDERYVFVNRAYEVWFGRPREEIVGRTLRAVFGEEGYARRAAQVAAALRGEHMRFETATVGADGSPRETELEYIPHIEPDGGRNGFFVFGVDVTERNRAARALHDGETRLRLALSAGRMAVWDLDLAGDVLTGSPELARLLALPQGINPRLADILARLDRDEADRLRALVRRALARGARFLETELRYGREDGSARSLLVRAEFRRDETGKPARCLGVVVDLTDMREAEERRRKSEALNRAVLDAALDPIITISADSRVVEWNGAAERTFGYSRARALGADLAGLIIPPEYREAHSRGMAHYLGTGEGPVLGRRVELEALRADGSRFPCELAISTSEIDGAPYFTAYLRDITDRREAEASIRAGEERLRDITDAVPALISYVDAEQRFRFVNKQYESRFDRPLDRIVGERLVDVMGEEVYEARRPYVERALAGERIVYEVDIARPGGVLTTEVTHIPHRDESGRVLGFYALVQDVTPRKKSEARLQELNAALERRASDSIAERDRIWDNSGELMVVGGMDGYLRSVNPAWHQLLGHEADMLLARPFWQLVHPEDLAGAERAVAALAGGEKAVYEGRLRRADGTWLSIEWTAVPGDGVFYAVGRNVTDQRAAEEALRVAQRMEAVGQLTGGVAHDFNNLLTIISGNLDAAMRQVADMGAAPERLVRAVENARIGARRAAEVTQRLLAFSRRQPLDARPVDANRLVEGMAELMRRTLGEHIEIRPDLADGLWPVMADPGQLESALLNLAVNARDAMPEGGVLTVATRNEADGEAANVVITVADTGSGMPPDILAKAFEPFFTTKGIGRGTGLGLSQVHGFVNQSGGTVRIESRPGTGTSVALSFPRSHFPAAQPAPHGAQDPGMRGGGETILIVEDEDDVRALSADFLSDLGYTVLDAPHGPAALDILAARRGIDLLFTDVGLPHGMNGRELAEEARRRDPALKVLFTTGYEHGALLHEGRLDGDVRLLTKPFTQAALAARIREALDAGGPVPPAASAALVLIVEDEMLVRMTAIDALEDFGLEVEEAASVKAARERLDARGGEIAAVILDIGLPDGKGDVLAREIRAAHPAMPVIIASGYGSAALDADLAADPLVSFIGKPYASTHLENELMGLRILAPRQQTDGASSDEKERR